MEPNKVKVYTNFLMDLNMMENGKMMINMVLGYSYMQMEINIKVNLLKVNNQDKEYIII